MMKLTKTLLGCVGAAVALGMHFSAAAGASWERNLTYTGTDGNVFNYWKLEQKPTDGSKVPLVIFLHGAGERRSSDGSNDGAQVTINFITPLQNWLINNEKKGFLLVAGQVPYKYGDSLPAACANMTDKYEKWVYLDWTKTGHTMPEQPSTTMSLQLEFLDKLLRENKDIDTSRVYVTGMSMGGFGTWDIICRRPDVFAAALPICGGGDVKQASKIASLPIWTFHGDADRAVPVANSRDMVAALQAAGSAVKYTEYAGEDHSIWNYVYSDSAVLEWFFSQKKSGDNSEGNTGNTGDAPGDDSGTGTDDNATGVNLVTNGTFEDGSSYDGGKFAYATDSGVTLPTGWTFSSGKSGISKTADDGWHKGNAVAVEGSNWSVFLQEYQYGDGGSIEQDVAFPSAGGYVMEFKWIGRPNESWKTLGVEILLGDESIATVTREKEARPDAAYEKVSFTFDVREAGTKRLKIVQKQGNGSFCIDQVAVYSTQPSEPVKTFTVSVQETVCLGEDGRAEPPVTVTDTEGNVLTAGTHYTVTYSDNTAVGTGKVTVTGIAPYSGTVDKTFEILPGNTGDTPGDDSGTGTDDDATGVNLVTNGTFEEGTVCSKGWEYSYDAVKDGVTLPNGWTFSSEKSGISKTADGTWHIGNTEAVKGSNWSVFLQEYQYGDGGSIEQDVTFSSKGSYTMEFMWIGRPNESWKTLGVEILLDGKSIATVTRAKEARPDAAYEKVSFTFDVREAGTKRLKIVQKKGNGSFCIDQVAVYATKAGPSGFLIIVR